MYEYDDPTAIASRPASTSPGTPGWFTDGNPGAGIPATILRAEFMNMLQAELLAILTAGAITPNKAVSNQLLLALTAIFTANANWIGSNQSVAASGYQKLPGNLIVQWGAVTSPGLSGTLTWPIAFPHQCFSVVGMGDNSVAYNSGLTFNLSGSTTTGIGYFQSTTGAFSWIAIGW